jgi:hypothetical protein
MSKTILYPFRIDTDFRVGYAWSSELARRLKARLSLFTTFMPLPANSSEPVADIYHALAEAQGFYIKNFQLLPLRLRPIKSERVFVTGEFAPNFNSFLDQRIPDVIVLQSDLFSNEFMKQMIDSKYGVIVLSTHETPKTPATKKDRSQLFIDILQHAAIYNIPASFFKIISQDTSLFNYLASFFKK